MSLVFVQNDDGTPLMPTGRNKKVRELLRDQRAVVVCRIPFTIRLCYHSRGFVQKVNVGVDLGSKHVAISATTQKKELLAIQVELRTDVTKKISEKKQYRRSRRYRDTRHREARFNNRVKVKGWLPPSIQQKENSVISKLSTKVDSILPVSMFVFEIAKFDTQKLKDPNISGEEYQNGNMLNFYNVREYVFWKSGYKCQYCKGKSGDPVLHMHHIESRQTGGNSPDNLVALCETCHKRLHAGEIKLNIKRGKSYRDAAYMNSMKKSIYNKAVSKFGKERVSTTMGYITTAKRKEHGIAKSHLNDALCISGNPTATPAEVFYTMKDVTRHSRSLHVSKMKKGGKRRRAVADHWIGGSNFQRYDFVQYGEKKAFISGSTNGRLVLRNIDWTRATDKPSVSAKSVKFLYRKKGSFIIQEFKR